MAALFCCAFGSGTEARQGHKVILEAGVGRPLPFPLALRGEEGVLEAHAGGRGLEETRQRVRNCSSEESF